MGFPDHFLQKQIEGTAAYYLTPNTLGGGLGTLSSYQGIVNPSVGNVATNFGEDEGFLDFWVVDGVVSKAGSQNVKIAVMGSDLAENLFSQNQLNVPMAQFFTANGPMSSVVKDASADNYTGWSNGNICDASDTTWTDNPSGGLTAPPPPGGTRTLTTTTLVSPMSGVLGHDMGSRLKSWQEISPLPKESSTSQSTARLPAYDNVRLNNCSK